MIKVDNIMDELSCKRNYGIELLRIIAMIWIVAFHYSNKGIVDLMDVDISPNWILLSLCNCGGYREWRICPYFGLPSLE